MELMKQLQTDPNVGSFFKRPDVLDAEAAVSEEAKSYLADLVSEVKIVPVELNGHLHHHMVQTLRYAFSGEVVAFFHDLLGWLPIRNEVVEVLEGLENRHSPQATPLQKRDYPLVAQLLRVARLEH